MKLPISNEAEQGVLGGLMMKNDGFYVVRGVVSANDFYRHEHRIIFNAISDLAAKNSPFDVVTLSDHLGASGELETVGGMLYVGTLAKDTPSAASMTIYAEIVARTARARYAIEVMGGAISDIQNTPETDVVISETQSKLESSASGTRPGKSFADVLSVGIDQIEYNRERRNSGKLPGVSFYLPAINERTGGMRPGQLIVVAARPSIGKTALVHQIALRSAMEGIPVGEISIEMSEQQLANRSFANRFNISGTALMFGYDEPIQQLTDGLANDPEFKNIPLHVDTATDEYNAITSRIIEWKHKHDIKLVVVDHLGLIRCDGFFSNNDRLGHITSNLKKLAKRLEIPIVVVSQFSRGVEKDKRRPVLSDLRDSGNIEQDADICLFMHQDVEDLGHEVQLELGLLKNRDGMRGWLQEQFFFEKRTQTIREC